MLLLLFYLIIQRCSTSHAQDLTALRLVQCIRAECSRCDRNQREPAAIAHVLRKQALSIGRTLEEQTVAYCAMFRRRSPRSRAIWSATFEMPGDWRLVGRRKWWTKMAPWSRLFLAGKIPDPLPRARHWGGDMDIPRALRLGLVRVAGPPEYCNTFWAIPPKGQI
jgi:hypothetical protein